MVANKRRANPYGTTSDVSPESVMNSLFDVTCPDTHFVETTPGPPENEK
jgi:hypothetical protein